MVEHSLWEQVDVGSNPIIPIALYIRQDAFYSVEYWQENWETLMERVENGETIGVENENGERAVMDPPADDELLRLYIQNMKKDHEIIDNFLSKEDHEFLVNTILKTPEFPFI